MVSLLLATLPMFAGCSSGAPGRTAAPAPGGPAATPGEVVRPAALIEGRRLTWEDLRPALSKIGGGQALEEAVLDSLLAVEAERRGIVIGEAEIASERVILIEAMAVSAGAAGDEDAGERALAEVRRSRGLGQARFGALLRRTALLRTLSRADVEVSERDVREAYELEHGARFRARILTADTADGAAEARRRIAEGELFGVVAAEMSTDSSAARGGIIEPINAADSSYPAAIRAALSRLSPGELSPPVAIDAGYAVLLLEAVIPGTGRTFEEARAEAEARARARAERIAMEALAQRLLGGASVTVFDAALGQSWRWRQGGE